MERRGNGHAQGELLPDASATPSTHPHWIVTTAELAELFACSASRIRQWAQEGLNEARTKNGQYWLPAAIQWRCEQLQLKAHYGDSGESRRALYEAQTARTLAQVEEIHGSTVSIEAASRAYLELAHLCGNAFDALPVRCSDDPSVRDTIERECDAARERLHRAAEDFASAYARDNSAPAADSANGGRMGGRGAGAPPRKSRTRKMAN